MAEGSCYCGKIQISFAGEPLEKVLCHCRDCRKIGGGTHSVNLIVPEEGFIVTGGPPKSFTSTGASGKHITGYFCADCGSTLFRIGEALPGVRIVKAGVMNDDTQVEAAQPSLELFVKDRISWVPAVEGCDQKQAM